jgi:hypothetical protein
MSFPNSNFEGKLVTLPSQAIIDGTESAAALGGQSGKQLIHLPDKPHKLRMLQLGKKIVRKM